MHLILYLLSISRFLIGEKKGHRKLSKWIPLSDCFKIPLTHLLTFGISYLMDNLWTQSYFEVDWFFLFFLLFVWHVTITNKNRDILPTMLLDLRSSPNLLEYLVIYQQHIHLHHKVPYNFHYKLDICTTL